MKLKWDRQFPNPKEWKSWGKNILSNYSPQTFDERGEKNETYKKHTKQWIFGKK